MDYYGDAPRGYQRGGYYDDPYGSYGSRGSSSSYSRFAIPGWLLIILGFVLLVLGFVDIGWTATRYGAACAYDPTVFYDPCDANHLFTYISSPVWGGVIIMATGLVAVMMTPRRLMNNSGAIFYILVGLCLLVVFLVAPAIVVLNSLELALNDETFFNSDVAGSLATMDTVKFAFPIVLAILGFVGFAIALTVALVTCFCRPMADDEGDMLQLGRPDTRIVSVVSEPRYAPRRQVAIREVIEEPTYRPMPVSRTMYRPYDFDRDFGDYGSYGSYGGGYGGYGSRYGARPAAARSLRPIRY